MTFPRFSLIIPAHNEALLLPALLDSVEAARRQYRGVQGLGGLDAIEVIVADNASTDNTAAIAAAHGCRVVLVEKRAIAAARNGGAAIALGEIVCFIDADSRIHADTFNAIEQTLASGRVIVGATGVKPDRWSLGLLATWLFAAPVALLMSFDAGVVFCRRIDFETVGGYDESLTYAEDIQFLVDLKRLGRKDGRKQRFARARGAPAVSAPPTPALFAARNFRMLAPPNKAGAHMKLTAQFWQQHVLAAGRSSDSTSAYAKRHGLAVSTLYCWQSKLKAAATPPLDVGSPATRFVALRVIDAAPTPRPNHCTLVLPAGMRLEMTALPAPEWLAAVGQAALGHAAQGGR